MTFLNHKSSTEEKPEGTHRLIWTKRDGTERRSELLDRDEALRQFAAVNTIRRACDPNSNMRLRVVAETERLAALKRLAAAALVAL